MAVPPIPPQKTPPIDGLEDIFNQIEAVSGADLGAKPFLLSKVWWLFFNGLRDAANASVSPSGGYYIIPIAGTTATPDISRGRVQVVIPSVAVTVLPPIGGSPGNSFTLRVIQGAVPRAVTFDPAYLGMSEIAVQAHTYSCQPIEIDDSGNPYASAAPLVWATIP